MLTLMGGTIIAQGIAYASSPILTRVYQPSDFGLLEIYSSLVTILATLGSLRYQFVIPLPQDDRTAAHILRLSCMILLGVILGIGGVSLLFENKILVWLNAVSFKPYISLIFAGVLGAGTYQIFNLWAIRKQAFGLISRTRITQSFSRALIQTSLGFFAFGPVGLVLGDVVGQWTGCTRLALLAWNKDKESLRGHAWGKIWEAAKRYKRFPLLTGPAAFLNSLGNKFPSILLASFYGLQVAGWYSLAQLVLWAPSALISNSAAQVYMGESARLAKQAPFDLTRLFWQTIKIQTLFAVPIVLLIAVPAPYLFPLIFGGNWVNAGTYVQVSAIMLFMELVSNPVSPTLDVLERQDLGLIREILRATLMSGAVMLAVHLNQGPITAIFLLAIAGSTTYLLNLLLVWYSIFRYQNSYIPSEIITNKVT